MTDNTPRHYKILERLNRTSKGLSSTELANIFGVAPDTIRTWVRELRDHLALFNSNFTVISTRQGSASKYVLTADQELIDQWVASNVQAIEDLSSRLGTISPDKHTKASLAEIVERAITV